MSSLQAALPREMYVDPASWTVERDRVLFSSWACVGRVSDLGLSEPGRLAVVDVAGESVVVTRDDDGPARGVQRLPAPRLAAGAA